MNESQLVTATRGAVARALAGDKVTAGGPMADYILGLNSESITSEESCQALVDAAKVCKLAHKEVDDQRKSITAPLKQATDAANALANPVLTKLKSAMDHAKKLYDGWKAKKDAEERQRLLEQQRIEREAAAKRASEAAALVEAGAQDVDLPPEASVYTPPATTQVKGGLGAMHQQVRKKLRVTNVHAAVAAHEELFDIKLRQTDAKALLERMRAADPDAQLTGIEEYDDVTTALT